MERKITIIVSTKITQLSVNVKQNDDDRTFMLQQIITNVFANVLSICLNRVVQLAMICPQ